MSGFRIRINNNRIRRLTAVQKMALDMTGEALKTEINNDQVVPKQDGTLEMSAFIDNSDLNRGRLKLIYDTPYARKLYYHPEYNFRTDKNPHAKGNWLDDYIDGDKKDFAQKAYARCYRRLAGT
jgi:hypothetical protein